MTQPVELIATNIAHKVISSVGDMIEMQQMLLKKIDSDATLAPETKKTAYDEANRFRHDFATNFAEKLLCSIAHNASDHVVRKALAAIGAPHEDDEIWQRIDSAREAQRAETGEVHVEDNPEANTIQ